jgi:hypothetical protein
MRSQLSIGDRMALRRARVMPKPVTLRRPTGEERTCKYCGCTDTRACPDGCCWIAADVCSACAEELSDLL